MCAKKDNSDQPATISPDVKSTDSESPLAELQEKSDKDDPKETTRDLQVTVDSFTKLKDLVELAGKSFLGLVGFLYITGFIVVNAYLYKFGIYTVSLLQANYITAGLWASLHVTIPIIIVMVGRSLMPPDAFSDLLKYFLDKGQGRGKSIDLKPYIKSLIYLGVYIILLVLLAYMAKLQYAFLDFKSGSSRPWQFLFISNIILVVVLLIMVKLIPRSERKVLTSLAPLGMFILILFLTQIIYFGRWEYETIPSYLGGGSPQEVTFIIEANEDIFGLLEAEGISSRGLDKNNNEVKTVTQPVGENASSTAQDQTLIKEAREDVVKQTDMVKLITVTDKEYIIQVQLSSISIPRDAVKLVKYKSTYFYND